MILEKMKIVSLATSRKKGTPKVQDSHGNSEI